MDKGAQPVRYAIQKARGKGWKTLEVGEELAQAEARFDLMVKVNPRAYFRLVQLDYNEDSDYEGMEFNWKLIHLYDPTAALAIGRPDKGMRRNVATASVRAADAPRTRGRGGTEKVKLPIRFYLGVVLAGALAGLLAYMHFVGGVAR